MILGSNQKYMKNNIFGQYWLPCVHIELKKCLTIKAFDRDKVQLGQLPSVIQTDKLSLIFIHKFRISYREHSDVALTSGNTNPLISH